MDYVEFKDGIAFYKDKREIAFYSNITNNINYYNYGIKMAYPKWISYGCLSIPIEDNIFIIEEIQRYLSAKK